MKDREKPSMEIKTTDLRSSLRKVKCFLALGYAEFIGICISIQSPIFSGQLDMQIIENKCGIKMWELSSLR